MSADKQQNPAKDWNPLNQYCEPDDGDECHVVFIPDQGHPRSFFHVRWSGEKRDWQNDGPQVWVSGSISAKSFQSIYEGRYFWMYPPSFVGMGEMHLDAIWLELIEPLIEDVRDENAGEESK
jgi:hypothetical protein